MLAILTVGAASADAEIQQRGSLRVVFSGEFRPHALPRQGTAPIAVAIGGRISTTDGRPPPQLRRITIEINRNGHLGAAGLPSCGLDEIQPSTSQGALAACRDSLVGSGNFSANVELPQQAPFPSHGKVLAFAGTERGKPVILAHVYGTEPVPTSYTLLFEIRRSTGTYGTVLTVSLPRVTSDWGFVTGLDLRLNRRFAYRGSRRSYLSAGCPAARGFPGAVFPLVRASFAFGGGMTVTSVLNRACRAK